MMCQMQVVLCPLISVLMTLTPFLKEGRVCKAFATFLWSLALLDQTAISTLAADIKALKKKRRWKDVKRREARLLKPTCKDRGNYLEVIKSTDWGEAGDFFFTLINSLITNDDEICRGFVSHTQWHAHSLIKSVRQWQWLLVIDSVGEVKSFFCACIHATASKGLEQYFTSEENLIRLFCECQFLANAILLHSFIKWLCFCASNSELISGATHELIVFGWTLTMTKPKKWSLRGIHTWLMLWACKLLEQPCKCELREYRTWMNLHELRH